MRRRRTIRWWMRCITRRRRERRWREMRGRSFCTRREERETRKWFNQFWIGVFVAETMKMIRGDWSRIDYLKQEMKREKGMRNVILWLLGLWWKREEGAKETNVFIARNLKGFLVHQLCEGTVGKQGRAFVSVQPLQILANWLVFASKSVSQKVFVSRRIHKNVRVVRRHPTRMKPH